MIYVSIDELVTLFFSPKPGSIKHRRVLAGMLTEEELAIVIDDWMVFLSSGLEVDRIIQTPKELKEAILKEYRKRRDKPAIGIHVVKDTDEETTP